MIFFRRVKYWYNFASKVWLSLMIGWLFVAVGLTPILEIKQAGALLICFAVIAEVFHDKRHRLFIKQVLPGVSISYEFIEVEMSDGAKGIEITPHQLKSGSTTVNANSWHLYHLANPKEFREFDGKRAWDLEATMKRLESRINLAVVISIIVGTVLSNFF